MHSGEIIKSQLKNNTTHTHYNVLVSLDDKGPCLHMPHPNPADPPTKAPHFIRPHHCWVCCPRKQEGTGGFGPNPVLLLQEPNLHQSTCCISHSGPLHSDKILFLPKQLLFLLTGYFCITSSDPAEHIHLGRSTSNWHKDPE